MIDPNEPLELDDGTPVKFVRLDRLNKMIYVSLPPNKSHMRDGTGNKGRAWWYNIDDGVWNGDDNNQMFTIRNADLGPPSVDEWE